MNSRRIVSLRHRIDRSRVPEIAIHLEAGCKLAICWRERLHLDASRPISHRESRPVFAELLARPPLRLKTEFQVIASIFREPGLGRAAAACGYIPAWDTIRCRFAWRKPHADGNGRNGN